MPAALGLRSEHEAGVVHQRHDRQVEGVGEADEAGQLVGGVAVDGPGDRSTCGWLAMTATAWPPIRTSDVIAALAQFGRSSNTLSASARARDHPAHVVDAAPVVGDDRADRVVGRRRRAVGALDEEVGEVAAHQLGALGVGVDQQVGAADLLLHLRRRQLLGRHGDAEGGLDERRAADADGAAARGEHDVGHPGDAGVAGERAPRHDGDRRHPARHQRHAVERADLVGHPCRRRTRSCAGPGPGRRRRRRSTRTGTGGGSPGP